MKGEHDKAKAYLSALRRGSALNFEQACLHLGGVLQRLHDLQETPQDPQWHAEGNVAIHTKMVCEALESELANMSNIEETWTSHELFVLRLATLLHDIGKPMTTTWREMDGASRCVAPGHAARGADYLMFALLGVGLSPRELFDVTQLVRLHHEPKFLIIKNRPKSAYIKLARETSLKLLWALEMADMRGRICEDQADQIEYIELFRLGAMEHGVWEQGFWSEWVGQVHEGLQARGLEEEEKVERALMEGVWAMERGEIFTPQEAVAKSYALDERFCRVVMAFGASGSGKTTAMTKHFGASFEEYEVVSMDELRADVAKRVEDQSKNVEVAHRARQNLRLALGQARDVVWDATNLRREFRAPVTGLSRDYKAHVTLVIMMTPESLAQERNAARSRTIPSKVIQKQYDMLEWPSLQEAHRIIWLDHEGTQIWDTRQIWRALIGN